MHSNNSVTGMILRFTPKYLFGVSCSFYLFTVGILRKANRKLVWQICRHFGWNDHLPPPMLEGVSADALMPETPDIKVLCPVATQGNVSATELIVINQLTVHYGLTHAFEIGTFNGRTTLNIAANAGPNGKVASLDLPDDHDITSTAYVLAKGEDEFTPHDNREMLFADTKYASRITRLRGDSALFDFRPYAGTQDLVFIDGSHAYDYVLKDSRTALSLLKASGGIILWHDYGEWRDVTTALDMLQDEDDSFLGLRHIEGTTLAILNTGQFAKDGASSK